MVLRAYDNMLRSGCIASAKSGLSGGSGKLHFPVVEERNCLLLTGGRIMVKRRRRVFTVEEKLRLLEEARQPNTSVAEVLRRSGLDAATFYRWERMAKQGMREALNGKRRAGGGAAREVERLEAELVRKRQIIAEVVEENLALKKGL